MKSAYSLGVLVIAALPLAAQRPGPPMPRDSARHGMMPGREMMAHWHQMGDMMGPMTVAMAFAPDHLLQRKDALGLSAQQVTRLTTLRDGAKAGHQAAAADAKQRMEALRQAMQSATSDTAALRRAFQAAHDAMGAAHWTMLRTAAQAKAVLTDEQRGRVNGWADAMQMHRRWRVDAPDRDDDDKDDDDGG
jgi:hypothetical protein